MTMKPPPPGPATHGTVTPRALAVATAASTALPPRLRTSMPAWLAPTSMEATAPPLPVATGVTARAAAGWPRWAWGSRWADATAGAAAHAATHSIDTRVAIPRRP